MPKERKHNIRVYTKSVLNAKKYGGFYVVGRRDNGKEVPLSKDQQYIIDLANMKMKKNKKTNDTNR